MLATHGKCVQILDPILQHVEYNSHSAEPILKEHSVTVGLQVLSWDRGKIVTYNWNIA
jgi:hypothetical protein